MSSYGVPGSTLPFGDAQGYTSPGGASMSKLVWYVLLAALAIGVYMLLKKD